MVPHDVSLEPFGEDGLGQALEELRAEIHARLATAGAAPGKPRVWSLFDALRHRLGRLGMSSGASEIDAFGLDTRALASVTPVLDFLLDRYWQVVLLRAEALPRPALLVANRGGILPYDGLLVSHALARRYPGEPRPRFLVGDGVESLPFVNPRLTQWGAVRAAPENALRLLREGSSVIVFPEGREGSQKPFSERYGLKSFGRGGVVRVALEAGVPLVPVGIVGGEDVHPLVARLPGREPHAGLPFFPVTPTFPLLGLAGLVPLPVRWVIAFGEPVDLEASGVEAARDELLVARLVAGLRARIEALLREALEVRSRGRT